MHLAIHVQHHPKRAHLLPALLAALGGAEVVTDPDPNGRPNPWRCYEHALRLTPALATHVAVIQDDCVPAPGFRPALEAAVRARPDRLIVAFVGGAPFEHARALWRASDAGHQWAELDNFRWCPVVANVWPRRLIQPCLDAVAANGWARLFTADDEIIGQAVRYLGETALATVPSLVEHADVHESLVGRRAMGGKDRGRVGACQPGPDCDLAAIDWTVGPG